MSKNAKKAVFNSTKDKRAYGVWKNMMERCYNPNHKYYARYGGRGVYVFSEWHDFQVFCNWYYKKVYFIEGQRIELDKDILSRGYSPCYSPMTCCFVPKSINTLLIKADKIRGEYPVGVYKHWKTGKYEARCNDGNGTRLYLGQHESVQEAFYAYKVCKEAMIKDRANQYIEVLDPRVYQALLAYEVDILD